MPFKTRTETYEFKILRIVNTRMDLPESEKKRFLKLKKGFEGEVKFDSYTACLDNQFLILNDLALEVGNTSFQIDSLLLTQNSIVPCEVKNFERNYFYENDNFYYCHNKKAVSNPLHQLNRGEILLRQLIESYGFRFPVKGNLIFTNPEFFLYQAPFNHPEIIYHSHLNPFIKELSMRPSNLSGQHQNLAELLVRLHNPDTSRKNIPDYTYQQFRKGITCSKCLSFSLTVYEGITVCDCCGNKETIQAAVVRSVEELRFLFPQVKITTNLVHDWCAIIESRKTIRKILHSNYQIVGHSRYSYFIDKKS
jgi:hypothetical protein